MYEKKTDKKMLDALRELLTDGDMFVICSPGGLVTYCSATLRELLDEDLRGRSLHYFISDEDAARIIVSAQSGRDAEINAGVGGKHFRCRMRPCQDKTFVIVFMPVTPEGSAFIRYSSAALMQREIRDSIQVILGALGQRKPAQEQGDQMYQAMIRRQSLRLLRLCDNMMDLATYQNGAARLEAEDLDLRELLWEFGGKIEQYLGQAGVRVWMELPEEPCTIRGDREKLLRILLNLVTNSVQAAGEQHLVIRIRLSVQPDQYRIIYRDSAPGDPEAVDRIFDKHLHGDPFSGEALGGAGFGISLVKAFTDLHGGSVVFSADAEGKPAFVICLRHDDRRPISPLRAEGFRYREDTDLYLKELSPVLELQPYLRT